MLEQEVMRKDLVNKLIRKLIRESSPWPRNGKEKIVRNLLVWAEREYGGKSGKDISKQFNICRERVYDIHKKYSRKLPYILKEL